ncbi:hypothetical protein [Paenibacillus anseongense]|uniref:hypothetical protein n=1 Tax=Paenibacillus anseongense TaxID=2682845 RepID=UPI002DB721BF|nr:hypothetical protein [Paenibacillus anseongense]MEC0270077.1 hypothetical protein [Paenibacillus anseongense]
MTAEDVINGIDLSGKTAIVTGAYSGLDLETVRVLRSAGARLSFQRVTTIKQRTPLQTSTALILK